MTTIEAKPHPAKFSPEILDVIADLIRIEMTIVKPYDRIPLELIDPMAGTGRIHDLMMKITNLETYGIEIEPEWACYHTRTSVGNALALPNHWTGHFDIAATSCTYGNRMADNHNAQDGSIRVTYKHKLGRDPHPESSATLHFGKKNKKYEEFHAKAWEEVARVVRRPYNGEPGGIFILNVSDFIRTVKGKAERMKVCEWHVDTLLAGPWDLEVEVKVPTKRMGFGANSKARVEHEMVYLFRRTE